MIFEGKVQQRLVAAALVLLTLGFISSALAQDPDGRPKRGEAPPASDTVKPDAATALNLMKALSDQVRELTAEVKRLRKTMERNDQTMELLLSEEKLARIEDNLVVARQRGADLDTAEQGLQYRENHINEEVILRGGLDRQATETAVRADIEQRFQELHTNQAANQKRVTSLESDATQLRNHIQELQRTINSNAERSDSPK